MAGPDPNLMDVGAQVAAQDPAAAELAGLPALDKASDYTPYINAAFNEVQNMPAFAPSVPIDQSPAAEVFQPIPQQQQPQNFGQQLMQTLNTGMLQDLLGSEEDEEISVGGEVHAGLTAENVKHLQKLEFEEKRANSLAKQRKAEQQAIEAHRKAQLSLQQQGMDMQRLQMQQDQLHRQKVESRLQEQAEFSQWLTQHNLKREKLNDLLALQKNAREDEKLELEKEQYRAEIEAAGRAKEAGVKTYRYEREGIVYSVTQDEAGELQVVSSVELKSPNDPDVDFTDFDKSVADLLTMGKEQLATKLVDDPDYPVHNEYITMQAGIEAALNAPYVVSGQFHKIKPNSHIAVKVDGVKYITRYTGTLDANGNPNVLRDSNGRIVRIAEHGKTFSEVMQEFADSSAEANNLTQMLITTMDNLQNRSSTQGGPVGLGTGFPAQTQVPLRGGQGYQPPAGPQRLPAAGPPQLTSRAAVRDDYANPEFAAKYGNTSVRSILNQNNPRTGEAPRMSGRTDSHARLMGNAERELRKLTASGLREVIARGEPFEGVDVTEAAMTLYSRKYGRGTIDFSEGLRRKVEKAITPHWRQPTYGIAFRDKLDSLTNKIERMPKSELDEYISSGKAERDNVTEVAKQYRTYKYGS